MITLVNAVDKVIKVNAYVTDCIMKSKSSNSEVNTKTSMHYRHVFQRDLGNDPVRVATEMKLN